MEDNGNLHVAGAHHQVDMPKDGAAQLLPRVRDFLDLGQHVLIQDIHSIVHYFKEQHILAAYVMVQARLGQADGLGDVLHGGAVVAFFVKHPRRDPADFA